MNDELDLELDTIRESIKNLKRLKYDLTKQQLHLEEEANKIDRFIHSLNADLVDRLKIKRNSRTTL